MLVGFEIDIIMFIIYQGKILGLPTKVLVRKANQLRHTCMGKTKNFQGGLCITHLSVLQAVVIAVTKFNILKKSIFMYI